MTIPSDLSSTKILRSDGMVMVWWTNGFFRSRPIITIHAPERFGSDRRPHITSKVGAFGRRYWPRTHT